MPYCTHYMNIDAHLFVHEAAHSQYPVRNIKVTHYVTS